MKQRMKPTLTRSKSIGAVTCYKPRTSHQKPSLNNIGTGAVTCYKPRKK